MVVLRMMRNDRELMMLLRLHDLCAVVVKDDKNVHGVD